MTEHFTDMELKAREILAAAQADEKKWSPSRAAVLNTFRAVWSRSLPAERVIQIATAINGHGFSGIPQALTVLTREGVLRSRRSRGVTHYEINL